MAPSVFYQGVVRAGKAHQTSEKRKE